jgi:RNA polymerase sigma-70 factor, ECF subfamily
MTTPSHAIKDHVLIQMVLAGRAECFDVLMDRHQLAVRRRIRSMTFDASHEDDFVQEVFLKAWRHLASFRSESSFRTWITRIAVNEVMQFYRRERKAPVCPALRDLDTYASSFESPHQSLERKEATQQVRSAIAKLPAMYREILVLRNLKELSEIEVARSIQGGIPMVKTRLFRARQLLSSALQTQHSGASSKNDLTMSRVRRKSQIFPVGKAA